MNPLNTNLQISNNNNPINSVIQFLDRGGSPQQLMEQMINPQTKQVMEQIKNVSNNQNPRDIAMQLCKERGVDPNQMMQLANRLGLK